ncbi:MAG: glycoside hydrolase family 15 protein [Acidimicrobiales bacterium]
MADAVNSVVLSDRVRRSVQSILANQHPSGAIIASPDFDQYHFCWLRDGSFIAYALDLVGKHDASGRYHAWVNSAVRNISGVIDDVIDRRQRGKALDPTDMPPARFALDGTVVVDGWPSFQIDGYGTWLWSLGQHLRLADGAAVSEEFRDSIVRVGRYLSTFALTPCYDVWEESGSALHTSTLACVVGGLETAGRLLGDESFLEAAASIADHLKSDATRVGHYVKSSENEDVDASVLWLGTPFRVVAPSDPHLAKTVAMVEDRLSLHGGLRRYPTDTYFGSGAWPVLTASLGWHYLSLGNLSEARRCRDWVADHFDSDDRLGEQFGGDVRDPQHYFEWVDRWGPPAQELVWSHAMFVVLATAIEGHDARVASEGAAVSGVLPGPFTGEAD